jgi:DNA-binding transcriptional LysR family regulator
MDLDGLALFVAIARHGGLNAASRETGVAKATLSRRLRELETGLGTILLDRGHRQLILTEEGRHLYDRAAPLLSDLVAAAAEVSARDGEVRGHLRVSVPALLARFGMGQFLASFLRQYPAVTLDIDANDRFVDPVAEGYDLVVRANPAPDSDLVGKCFLRTRAVLAAVPSIQIPQAQDMVVDAVGLSAGRGRPEWIIIRDGGELRVQPRRVLTCSSMMLVYEAVLAGAGMGILPVWLVQDDVARGRLRVWGDMAGEGISAWVLHPPAHLTSPRVKAFVDAIVAAFRDGPATGQ